jgi:hypothetical protein
LHHSHPHHSQVGAAVCVACERRRGEVETSGASAPRSCAWVSDTLVWFASNHVSVVGVLECRQS